MLKRAVLWDVTPSSLVEAYSYIFTASVFRVDE
jgi:hypothetical protein